MLVDRVGDLDTKGLRESVLFKDPDVKDDAEGGRSVAVPPLAPLAVAPMVREGEGLTVLEGVLPPSPPGVALLPKEPVASPEWEDDQLLDAKSDPLPRSELDTEGERE